MMVIDLFMALLLSRGMRFDGRVKGRPCIRIHSHYIRPNGPCRCFQWI